MEKGFDINIKTFNNPKESFEYDVDNIDYLQKSEKIILCAIMPYINNRSILDIAIGGGRTTKHLLKISDNYIGTELAPNLLQKAKKKFPDINIIKNDYRDLSQFNTSQFNFIFLSYNGLDYVNHQERLLVLREIKRILKPHGYFVFSSHTQRQKMAPFRFKFKRNLIKMVKHNTVSLRNYLRLKNYQEFHYHYSYTNNSGHRYGLLTYGISCSNQITQLREIGFHNFIYCIDNYGNVLKNDKHSDNCSWIYYCVSPRQIQDLLPYLKRSSA